MKANWWSVVRHALCALSFLIVMGVAAEYTFAAESPGLTIVQPTNASIVSPGGQIAVSVQQDAGASAFYFDRWLILLTNPPLPNSGLLSVDPYMFTVMVPTDATPGDYYITAIGLSSSSPSPVQSPPILVTIAAENVISLRPELTSIHIPYVGAVASTTTYGVTNTGTTIALPASQVTFTSESPLVVTVDQTGLITSQSAGTAVITIDYQNLTTQVVVTVIAQKVHGDLNNDGIVDVHDLAIIQGALNTPATGPNDARDLNHDGKIDILDLRIITTLCTHPRCASQ